MSKKNCPFLIEYIFLLSQTEKEPSRGVLLVITWLNEICLTSLIASFWNFPLMICNSPLLFSHFKNIQMLTLVTMVITDQLLIIKYYYSNN